MRNTVLEPEVLDTARYLDPLVYPKLPTVLN